MRILSTLALLGALAAPALAPQTSFAAGRKLVATHPQGSMQLQVHADGVSIDSPIPIYKGRIELTEGSYVPGLGKQFMLTKFIIGLQSFYIQNDAWGRVDFGTLGVHLRDALVWYGQEVSPTQVGGKYTINIPPDAISKTGDPTFIAAGLVTVKGNAKLQNMQDRVSEPITGIVDLDHGTITMRIVLEASTPAPWWQPWSDGITRKFIVTLKGQFPGPVKDEVDPEEPAPPRPVLVASNPNYNPSPVPQRPRVRE